MKKTVFIIAFILPFSLKAQGFESWRVATHFFLPFGIIENTEGGHKPKFMLSTLTPRLSYGLSGEMVFKLSNKIKMATGLGFEFKNYTEQVDK